MIIPRKLLWIDPSTKLVMKSGNVEKTKIIPQNQKLKHEPNQELNRGINFVVDVELHYHRVSDTFSRSKCILLCIDAISSVIVMAASYSVDKISFRSKIHG
jgi:hypothetical protein